MPDVGHAQNVFEKLVMPGPLIEGHAKLEADCKNCHEPFAKKAQTRLCLACHKKIAADRQKRKGFHGRRPDATTAECKHCHTDHVGRKAQIVSLDRETFKHDLTDFQLQGAHRTVSCGGCHAATAKFREAPGKCVDCHKKSEPHLGRLGTSCEDCHSDTAWSPIKTYDHNKTKFPLKHAHRKVRCEGCHAGERYTKLATTCVSCHDIQDVHHGRYGGKCESCHAPDKWKTVRFDHAKRTKFTLRGKHSKLRCESCHVGDLYKDKLSTKCVACHKKHDPHGGKLGSKCETCHNETGWRKEVLFDHDLTRFPLNGRHARVKCAACHRTRAYKDAPTECVGCHADRYHAGRFGPQCAGCHSPKGWEFWRFDHNRQTNFTLTGAHVSTSCHDCHRTRNVSRATAPRDCYSCHKGDDVHRGSFGRTCGKCHTTSNFRQLQR
ncbi:MAG: cytochrome c3 family protein [Hyphomicrobiaceae bacterium]